MNVNGLRSFLNSEKKKTLNAIARRNIPGGYCMGVENLSGLSEKFAGIETQNRS